MKKFGFVFLMLALALMLGGNALAQNSVTIPCISSPITPTRIPLGRRTVLCARSTMAIRPLSS